MCLHGVSCTQGIQIHSSAKQGPFFISIFFLTFPPAIWVVQESDPKYLGSLEPHVQIPAELTSVLHPSRANWLPCSLLRGGNFRMRFENFRSVRTLKILHFSSSITSQHSYHCFLSLSTLCNLLPMATSSWESRLTSTWKVMCRRLHSTSQWDGWGLSIYLHTHWKDFRETVKMRRLSGLIFDYMLQAAAWPVH